MSVKNTRTPPDALEEIQVFIHRLYLRRSLFLISRSHPSTSAFIFKRRPTRSMNDGPTKGGGYTSYE